MNIDWFAVAAIPVLTLILWVVIYLGSCGVRRGKPLLPLQKSMIFYACLFSFGMGYAIVLQDQIGALTRWSSAWIVVVVLWGIALALLAWFRRKQANKIENHVAGDREM